MQIFYIINIKYIEKGFLELYGPVGLYLKFRELNFKSKIWASNYIYISLFYIFVTFIFILFLIFINYIINFNLLYILLLVYYIIKI